MWSPLSPPFFKPEKPKVFSHSYRTFLQPFHHVWCLLMDMLEDLHIFLKLWGPELHTELQVRPHQAEYSRVILSPDCLVMLCLICPRMWFALLTVRAHCWFIFNLMSTITLRPFSWDASRLHFPQYVPSIIPS